MKKSGMKILALLLCIVSVLGMLPPFELPARAESSAVGEPTNTVFEDDFESYTVGAATTENMPDAYTDLGANCNFQIVDDGTGNKVLQGNTVHNVNGGGNHTLTISTVGGEREIVYDFCLKGTIAEYGGLYVDISGSHGYQMMPGYNRTDVTGVATPGKLSTSFAQNTWYSVKVRLTEGMTMYKLWAKNSGEPADWSFTSALSNALPAESTLTISLLHVTDAENANPANVWFDNFAISNWEEPVEDDSAIFTDDFNSHAVGALSGTGLYTQETGSVVADTAGSHGNYLSVTESGGVLRVATGKADKIISFDLMYGAGSNFNTFGDGVYAIAHEIEGAQSIYSIVSGAIDNGIRLSSSVESGGFGTASPAVGYAAGTWYKVKMILEGQTLSVKVWAEGSEEPEAWNAVGTTSVLPADEGDTMGFLFIKSNNITSINIDNLKVTAIPAEEPADPDPNGFTDDFESYEIGAATTENMPDAYTDLGANCNFQIVDDGTGNKVLQGNTVHNVNGGGNYTLNISTVGGEREISYDFSINGTISQYGGLYVYFGHDAERYHYAIMPNQNPAVTVSGVTNPGSITMSFGQRTWYSMKTRLAEGKLMIKIWAKGSEEPADWSFTSPLPKALSTSEGFYEINLLHVADQTTPAPVWFDNISIKPYEAPVLPGPFDIAVSTQDTMRGTVSGGGTFDSGEEVTVTATPNTGYQFKAWRANGSEASTSASYTFTASRDLDLTAVFYAATDTPAYAYFEDDYEDYNLGAVNRANMPLKYTEFTVAGDFQIVEDSSGNQMLQGYSGSQSSNGAFALDLNIIDKEILYDFCIGGEFNSYGGMYVTFHGQPEGGYYYSIMPDNNPQLIISRGSENIGRCYDVSFSANKWYTMKTRLVDEKIWIKVWEKGTAEPSAWSFTYSTADFELDGTYASFGMNYIQIDSDVVVPVWIDNLSVYTWAPLPEKQPCNITVKSSDETMGTVSGGGVQLERTEVSVTATPNPGYTFVNWTDEEGNEVSKEPIYKFVVSEDITLTANFIKTPVVIRSFMAAGLTQVAEIDEENQTVTARFASDVDLSSVMPYFYLDAGAYTEEKPYEEIDLSSGTATIGAGEDQWTIYATQNGVMQEFYVDCRYGDDANSGTSASDAFASLEAAQAAVRAIDSWTGDVVVHIAKGEYVLSDTLEFTTEDSADKGYAVIWDGGDANDVQITSGVPLDGEWTQSTDVPNLASGLVAWEYDATGIAYSRDMYVDGEMADLSTYMLDESSIGSWNQTDISFMEVNEDGYKVNGVLADMASWRNHSDIEFGYEIAWTFTIVPVASIEDLADGAQVNMKEDAFFGARHKNSAFVRDPNYIMNCFEGLDTAGEWYFDRAAEKIYYITDGADPNSMEIVLPTLDQLITVNGKSRDEGASGAEWVYGMVFKNIGFAYTSYLRPHTYGQVEIQASFILNLETMGNNGGNVAGYNFLKTDGAILASYTEGMRIQNCWFTNLAASGADFEEGCRGSQFVQNTIDDVCANGVTVGGVSGLDAQPYSDMNVVDGVLTSVTPDPDRVTEYTLILSNNISRVGLRYSGSIGIFAGYTKDTTIAHNTIYDASYSGISCSWGWGEFDQGGRLGRDTYKYTTPSVMQRYVIENNDISYVCQRLADGGGIYTLSYMPGSQLNGNYIHDNPIIFGGLYFDECSGGFTSMANNILYNCHTIFNYHLVHSLYAERENAMRTAFALGNNYVDVTPEQAADDARYQGIVENSGYLDALVPPAIDPAEILSPAEEVEAIIEALPAAEDITLEDAADVAEAREMFDALSEEEQTLVSNEDKLIAAEEAIEELLSVEAVEDLIEELPAGEEVSLADKEAISAARAAFDALDEDEQAQVENLDQLLAAEEALAPYLNAAEAEELMEALPDPELTETDDEEAVAALAEAQAAYEALTEAEKALVDEETVAAMEALAEKLSDYAFTSGDGSVVTSENYRDLPFVTNGAFSKFEGIEVDGVEVAAENYTAEAGSTHITLKAAYLGTLSAGKHTLTAIYTDGETECEFEIKTTSTGGGTGSGDGTGSGSGTGSGDGTGSGNGTGTGTGSSTGTGSTAGNGPDTGDHSNLTLWVGLAVLALAIALMMLGVVLKKTKTAKH